MKTLTLAFILKNEEQTIEKVIKSFWINGKPLYQELIVGIDNSSTDKTEEIVNQFTTKIYKFNFNKNFAASRNKIIKKCSCDYIFMPDGHEYLKPESREIIQIVLKKGYDNIRLISPYVGMFELDHFCCRKKCSIIDFPRQILPRPMFFMNKKNIWFKDAVHNYLDTENKYKRIMPEIMLEHRQSEKRLQDRIEQRQNMNIDGLKNQYKEADNKNEKSRSSFYLGNTYAEMGKLDDAFSYYKKALNEAKIAKDKDQSAQLCITIAYMYCQLEKFKEAKKVLIEYNALGCRWDRAEIYFLLGWIANGLKNYDEALHWWNININMSIPVTQYFIMMDMYTWFGHDALMELKVKMNDYIGALQSAKKIQKFKPNCLTVKENIQKLQEKINKINENINTTADKVITDIFTEPQMAVT